MRARSRIMLLHYVREVVHESFVTRIRIRLRVVVGRCGEPAAAGVGWARHRKLPAPRPVRRDRWHSVEQLMTTVQPLLASASASASSSPSRPWQRRAARRSSPMMAMIVRRRRRGFRRGRGPRRPPVIFYLRSRFTFLLNIFLILSSMSIDKIHKLILNLKSMYIYWRRLLFIWLLMFRTSFYTLI